MSQFGWSDNYLLGLSESVQRGRQVARVIGEDRGIYRVQWDIEAVGLAGISGKMLHDSKSRVDYPSVGDWVIIDPAHLSDRAVIQAICPRKSTLQRKEAGDGVDVQILSTNVDVVFVATSANEDFNIRRLERYLAVTKESGARPVILLTKADLVQGPIDKILNPLQVELGDVAIHPLSQSEFSQLEFFPKYLGRGTTAVILGSSGVGKSTLINFLIGSEQIKTADVREEDGKGRHTTTSRSLYVTRFGGLIIDTPGMRELHLTDHAEGVRTQFDDIETLSRQCKFTDCKHVTEPGCAVRQALASGQLTRTRWESYGKLLNEVRHRDRKEAKKTSSSKRRDR